MTDYLVAHRLVFSTSVFQYQSVLAPVQCDAAPGKSSHFLILHIFVVHFLTVTMAQILRPQFSSFGVFLGHSDQNELYHTPLQSKIWDLGGRFFQWKIPLRTISDDMRWLHLQTSKFGKKGLGSFGEISELVINISNIAWCLSSCIGMFENEVTWPELEEPCITNLTLSAPLRKHLSVWPRSSKTSGNK